MEAAGAVATPGVTGSALLQPPKSSSSAIVVFVGRTAPSLLPQPPKSLLRALETAAGAAEDLYVGDAREEVVVRDCLGAAAAGAVVVEDEEVVEFQASVVPQASMLLRLLKPAADKGAGLGAAAGWERLKAEVLYEGAAALVYEGTAVLVGAGAGEDMSKRSPIEEVATGGG